MYETKFRFCFLNYDHKNLRIYKNCQVIVYKNVDIKYFEVFEFL